MDDVGREDLQDRPHPFGDLFGAARHRKHEAAARLYDGARDRSIDDRDPAVAGFLRQIDDRVRADLVLWIKITEPRDMLASRPASPSMTSRTC